MRSDLSAVCGDFRAESDAARVDLLGSKLIVVVEEKK